MGRRLKMLDPNINYNRSRMQEWSDAFWKRTMFIWMPSVIFYQLLLEPLFKKEQPKK